MCSVHDAHLSGHAAVLSQPRLVLNVGRYAGYLSLGGPLEIGD